jgi:hypothetical protein
MDFSNNKKYSDFTASSPLIEKRTLIKPRDNFVHSTGYENHAFEEIMYNRNNNNGESPAFEYSDSLSPLNDVMLQTPFPLQRENGEKTGSRNIYGDITNDLGDRNNEHPEESRIKYPDSLPDLSRLNNMRFKDHLYLVGRITPEDEDQQFYVKSSEMYHDNDESSGRRTVLPPINTQEINQEIRKRYHDQKRNKRNADYHEYGGDDYNSAPAQHKFAHIFLHTYITELHNFTFFTNIVCLLFLINYSKNSFGLYFEAPLNCRKIKYAIYKLNILFQGNSLVESSDLHQRENDGNLFGMKIHYTQKVSICIFINFVFHMINFLIIFPPYCRRIL